MLKTQVNEKRCCYTKEKHILSFQDCCPVSRNPKRGSYLAISYHPDKAILEVASLRRYIDSYQEGKGDIRSMEAMIQNIAKDCCELLQVKVKVKAYLLLHPNQQMNLICTHFK